MEKVIYQTQKIYTEDIIVKYKNETQKNIDKIEHLFYSVTRREHMF